MTDLEPMQDRVTMEYPVYRGRLEHDVQHVVLHYHVGIRRLAELDDKAQQLDVTAATMAGYQDLSEFERGVIVGAGEMGRSISEVVLKSGFSRATISRVYIGISGIW
ncbi:hypothetical protein TNCV_4404391 [Trichonephila clavipes]|uniref:Uncharacterized protein n=1 Tax=Trichonephila clavipes TaxID=2585209 RepID=A0A8X6SAH7_TRICX|nr:hypothetical protein TNCV_4404391 [Trichonephila clavipes]